MIRKMCNSDTDVVIDIWLAASIKSHHFVAKEFWLSGVESMRDIYIPSSESYVFEQNSIVVGFYSLYENSLAAIFVSPEFQGRGVGKELICHAKKQRQMLSLSVYTENEDAYKFYLYHGFFVDKEQIDKHTGHREYVMSWYND